MSDKSTALARREPHNEISLAERETAALRQRVEAFAASGLVPEKFRGKPDALMAVAISIRDAEMPVTLSTINQWWVDPKGVARPQVQFMIATGASKGVELWIDDDESNADHAVAYGQRAGQAVRKCTYTYERAKRAGLTAKENWKHIEIMLKWRALGELVKTAYPDVALGLPSAFFEGADVLSREEAQAQAVEVDLDNDDDVADAEIVADPADPTAPDALNPESSPISTASPEWVAAFVARCDELAVDGTRPGALACAIVRHVTDGERSEPITVTRGPEQQAIKAVIAEVVDGRWDVQTGEDGMAFLVEAAAPEEPE